MAHEGVCKAIIPMKRVTTAEGRAQGLVNLRGDMHSRVKQSPLIGAEPKPKRGHLSGYTKRDELDEGRIKCGLVAITI